MQNYRKVWVGKDI